MAQARRFDEFDIDALLAHIMRNGSIRIDAVGIVLAACHDREVHADIGYLLEPIEILCNPEKGDTFLASSHQQTTAGQVRDERL
jgi:hypothetical protein